jgi:hypothetical protein
MGSVKIIDSKEQVIKSYSNASIDFSQLFTTVKNKDNTYQKVMIPHANIYYILENISETTIQLKQSNI